MTYRLGDICSITKGTTGIMKAISGPYTMIALGETDKTHNEFQFDAKAVIIPLVSSTGHGHASMKRVKYCEGKFALGNILCAVVPNDESFVIAKYLHIYLHWNKEELLVSQMKGMANVSLPMNRIADVMVTVPSIEKQREIIELEQKLVEKELEADRLFESQLTQLDSLNQAILQEAVQGKLVPQDPSRKLSGEPASELLQRIKAEKAKSGKKEKPLPPIKPEEIPFDIPENWVWCRLGEICQFITSGSRNWNQYYSDSGDLFIRSQNIKESKLDLSNKAFVTLPENSEGQRTKVKLNDIVITITGAGVSNCAQVTSVEWESAYVSQHVGLIRLIEDGISKWCHLCIISEVIGKYQFKDLIYGDKPGLNLVQLNNLILPLPPLSEQKRIVAEVERQMAKTKQLKEHVLANQQATEQLLKALLHQAFEGEAA